MTETTKPKLRIEDLHPFLQFYLDFPEGFRLIEGAMRETRVVHVNELVAVYTVGSTKKGLIDLQLNEGNFFIKVGYLNKEGNIHYTTNPEELDGVTDEREALNQLERIASEVQKVFRLSSAPATYREGIPFERSAA